MKQLQIKMGNDSTYIILVSDTKEPVPCCSSSDDGTLNISESRGWKTSSENCAPTCSNDSLAASRGSRDSYDIKLGAYTNMPFASFCNRFELEIAVSVQQQR